MDYNDYISGIKYPKKVEERSDLFGVIFQGAPTTTANHLEIKNEKVSKGDLERLTLSSALVLASIITLPHLFLAGNIATMISNAIFKVTTNSGSNYGVREGIAASELEIISKEEAAVASELKINNKKETSVADELDISSKKETAEVSELEIINKKETAVASELKINNKKETTVADELDISSKKETAEVAHQKIEIDREKVEIDLSKIRYRGKIGEEEKDLSFLSNSRPDESSIGHILVIPQDDTDTSGIFKIPFEFMPDIKEGTYSAQYNAQSILARIGSLQTFSNVELATPTISAKYLALAEKEDSTSSYADAWMNLYTLDRIQNIQRMYESLVLPKFIKPENSSSDSPFSYYRPPFVKIKIGTGNTTLFTYPTLGREDLKSGRNSPEPNYKIFLVTSVSIEKNLEEPLVIENKKIIDTFGFTVNMDLLEVTRSYMDMYPDYETYFNSFKKVSGFNKNFAYNK